MKLSVCLDLLLRGTDPVQAVEALAAVGAPAIEFWSWKDKDLGALSRACRAYDIKIAGMCTSFFNLTQAAERTHYLTELEASLDAAGRIGCPLLISQGGPDTGEARSVQHASLAAGLKAAAPLLERAGVTLALEPLNPFDHPESYLTASDEAFALVREVGSPCVRVLYDIYHQQRTEGELLGHILPNLSCIAHFHAAGVPGRHELDSGEICYERLLRRLDEAGYTGYTGLEYRPAGEALDGVRRALAALS